MAKSSAASAIAEARSVPMLGRLVLPGPAMLRLRLILFALACMGFALLIASVHLLTSAWKDQRDMEERAQSLARSSAQSVDQEVASAQSLLVGLSVSPNLASGDLAAFHREASTAAAIANCAILLLDARYGGLESNLVNTNRPFGSSPSAAPPETESALRGLVAEVTASRRLWVTESAYSPFAKSQSVAVGIPIMRGDRVAYVLAAVLLRLGGTATSDRDAVPDGWFTGVMDRKGKFISSGAAGDGARPAVDAAMLSAISGGGGWLDALTAAGAPIRVSYARSPSTGLTGIAAIPSSGLEAPIVQARLLLGAAAALALIFAVAFGLVAAPNLSRPLERRIAETEERFGAVADTLPSILFIGHGNAECDFVSQRFYDYTGLTPGSAAGLGWAETLHPLDRERIRAMLAAPVQADALREIQYRLKGRDGSYRWFASRWRSIPDSKCGEARWIGIATDVDDLKQAEARLRQLSLQLMKAQDAERRRIAREIHDTTVQNLAAAAIEIDQVRAGSIPEGPLATHALVEARHLIDQSLQELRTLSYFFHPPMLDELGLASAIRWYARGVEKRAGLRVEVEGPEQMPRYSEEIESALFRVAQEALANVHRHSGSPEARIRIACDAERITLEVSDRGKGIPPGYLEGAADAPLGVGIPGMRLRLQQIGGCLKIESSPSGTAVRATVPAAARQAEEGAETKAA